MKTIRDFLRKHALLLLAALVVVSVPAGVALGKYAASVDVTNELNLNVSMKTYTIKQTNLWEIVYGNCVEPKPKSIVFAYSAPGGLEKMTYSSNGQVIDFKDTSYNLKSGSIYAYYDSANRIVYIAPETPGKMMAPKYCGQFLASYNGNIGSDYTYAMRNSLEGIDLQNLDTSNTTNMATMFGYNYALKSINFGHNFNTSNVTTMESMFYDCKKITSLDLSVFKTPALINMRWMFYDCASLYSIILTSFDTSNVTDMDTMFCDCTSLISLNLSSFDTSKVTNMMAMFARASKLATIYVSDKFVTDNVTNDSGMFSSCTALVGGSGSTFSSLGAVGKTYARIDRPSQPGYFTAAPGTATNSIYSATGTDEAANGFSLALDLTS